MLYDVCHCTYNADGMLHAIPVAKHSTPRHDPVAKHSTLRQTSASEAVAIANTGRAMSCYVVLPAQRPVESYVATLPPGRVEACLSQQMPRLLVVATALRHRSSAWP